MKSTLQTVCLRVVLLPVVRFCLQHGFKLQDVIPAIKEVFLECAAREFEKSGIDVSASKLAVATGVHRKDVTSHQLGESRQTEEGNLLTRLVGQWQTDRRFSKHGRARPLQCAGKESEFSALVRTVNSELNPYTVLFELQRAGLVSRQNDSLELRVDEYVPSGNSLRLFRTYAPDGCDLVSAVAENALGSPDVPNLHLRTEFDNISPEDLERLRRWSLAEGKKFHQKARRFLSQFDRDVKTSRKKGDGQARAVLTTFSFTEVTKETSSEG